MNVLRGLIVAILYDRTGNGYGRFFILNTLALQGIKYIRLKLPNAEFTVPPSYGFLVYVVEDIKS